MLQLPFHTIYRGDLVLPTSLKYPLLRLSTSVKVSYCLFLATWPAFGASNFRICSIASVAPLNQPAKDID